MLGQSALNFTGHRNLGTRPPNVPQPSPRPKGFDGAPNHQPAPGRPPCMGPALISTVIFSWVKTLQAFPQTHSCPSVIVRRNTNYCEPNLRSNKSPQVCEKKEADYLAKLGNV